MKRYYLIMTAVLAALCFGSRTPAQTPPQQQRGNQAPAPSPQQQQPGQPARPAGFDLMDYGVRIEAEPRLIVMMAALDAAGFDPTPTGQEVSAFRARVRADQADLDEALRRRLHDFFERNKLKAEGGVQPTPADQAARYVSLAYALGPAPGFEAPARTDDLPASVLEVLDFAPLLREFYRKSAMDTRLPGYLQVHRERADQLRRSTEEMVRFVLSYLHTRPLTTSIERVPVRAPGSQGSQKKENERKYTIREHERRFFIVPDLLAAPGAVNFRVIADDYYVIVPEGTDASSSELRRAYLRYVVDPIIVRFNREIAERRPQLKLLLDERTKAGQSVTPDVFITVARSLVTAADVRLDEAIRLAILTQDTRARLDKTTDATARAALTKEMQETRTVIEDESVARLAEAYEAGAVLSFFFSDQLRGLESSGFDISNFFADMIGSFDAVREGKRLDEVAAVRARALSARKARQEQRRQAASAAAAEESAPGAAERAALIRNLTEVEKLLQLRDYGAAEARLKTLLQQFQGEPRVFFALGQTASLWARDTTDDDLQTARLNQALTHYRMAVERSSVETEPTLVCRAHESMGRILAFLERPEEASKEFDAVLQANACDAALKQSAADGKKKLGQ